MVRKVVILSHLGGRLKAEGHHAWPRLENRAGLGLSICRRIVQALGGRI
jgi:hypothetical protein